MVFEFGKFKIDVDVEATREYYAKYGQTVLEDCGCINCQNFYAVMSNPSDKVRDFFDSLGVDPLKSPEATWFTTFENGTAYYYIYYHLVGTIIQAEDTCTPATESRGSSLKMECLHEIDKDFKVGFRCEKEFVWEKFPDPCIQLEIDARLPWVLD